jgi:hypothetical protein
MGFFDSSETEQKKERIKKMRGIAATKGISSIINPQDYQKVLIEQNEAIINLLAVNAIAVSGLAGDAVTIVYLNSYYEALERITNGR